MEAFFFFFKDAIVTNLLKLYKFKHRGFFIRSSRTGLGYVHDDLKMTVLIVTLKII